MPWWKWGLKAHYDKILHITVTFMLILYLERIISLPYALLLTFLLQGGKVIWNLTRTKNYRMVGDWVANIVGYALAAGYLWTG